MNETAAGGSRRIWKGLAIALLAAIVLLFTVVLPAERGYDPTGIGRLLGLDVMHPKAASQSIDEVIADVTGGNDNLVAAEGAGFNDPIPLPNPAIHQAQATQPRTDRFDVTLPVDGKTEIKALLKKSKVVLYEWSVDGGQVYVDFHGHDPAKGDRYWVRYGEGDGVTGGKGSLVAPFDGEHGWFWLNVSETPVTIHLTVTGYQDGMKDYGLIP